MNVLNLLCVAINLREHARLSLNFAEERPAAMRGYIC